MATLERAIEIAARAHAGQIDKTGQPYFLHPLRVMLAVQTPHERMAAVLHDVVEDTEISAADLEQEGFAPEVIAAVRALTKLPGESRIDAARRAAADPIARAVKLADVADNMDFSRIAKPSEKDVARLKEYEQVRLVLLAGTVQSTETDALSRERVAQTPRQGGNVFEVLVADNFHYMDESETVTHGQFATWDEAVSVAKQIVDRYLTKHHKAGMPAEELYDEYTSFGDDPFIRPEPDGEKFSAWEYAKQRCSELCQ